MTERTPFVRQDLATGHSHVRYAGIIGFTSELMRDAGVAGTEGGVQYLIEAGLDHVFRPWRYPDRNPMPHVTPFPRLARLRWLR